MNTIAAVKMPRMQHGYKPAAIVNYVTPRNVGRLTEAHGRGHVSSTVGDEHLELSIKMGTGNTIVEARFRAVGCPALIASGSVLTQLVQGKPLQVALAFTPEDLDYALGRLPDQRRYATALAITALRKALNAAWTRQQSLPL